MLAQEQGPQEGSPGGGDLWACEQLPEVQEAKRRTLLLRGQGAVLWKSSGDQACGSGRPVQGWPSSLC